jgi:ABC-2 type transport system ATP-binding protein
MTGRELLVLQARLFGTGAAEARRQADRLMETVGLDDVPPKKRVGDYSGGMKRRLDLALALVHDPGILFLDEPTTGLDPISRAAIWEEVRRLNRERAVTIFLTTQYLEEADRLADDVAIIDKGRIVLQGSPAELKRDVGSETVKLTFADADAARRADQALREMGRRRHLADRELTLYFAAAADVIPDVVRLLDGAGIQLHGVEVSQPTLDDVFLQATGVRLGDRDGATSATDADGSASAAAADRETSAVDAGGAAGAADTDGPAADGGRAASRSPAREEVRP